MQVYIPWKSALFPLLPHQQQNIEYDSKGQFVRIRNAQTNRLNKCRVSHAPNDLQQLVGGTVSGIVAQTGPHYVALLIDRVDGIPGSVNTIGTKLVQMAREHLRKRNISWNVNIPRSWDILVTPTRELGPHVSLHVKHMKDVNKRVSLKIVGVKHWQEASRWVALVLSGPLTDHTNWILHLSCAQA